MAQNDNPESTPDPQSTPASRPNRRRRIVLILAGILAAAVIGGGVALLLGGDDDGAPIASGDSPTTPATPDPEPTPSVTEAPSTTEPDGPETVDGVRWEDVSMQEGLIQRQYTVLEPDDISAGESLPVVFAIHGLAVDRYALIAAADWQEAVAADRFVAVFPQAALGSWNAGACCPPASLMGIGDTGFLDKVTSQVADRPGVDPERFYLTGFSNGGIMTYAEACNRADLFAAIAPLGGTNVGGCSPAAPISTLDMHGDPDPVVPYDGGMTLAQALLNVNFPPATDSVEKWATDMGCRPSPKVESDSGGGATIERRSWKGCPKGVDVEMITYPGNGHNWPSDPVDGLDEILRFFDIRD